MPLSTARRLPLGEQPTAAPKPLYPQLFATGKPGQQFALRGLQFLCR